MGMLCSQGDPNNIISETIPYVTERVVVILNFKTPDDAWSKPISIHDENILAKGIQMFLESARIPNKSIKKAVYEGDSSVLNIKKKISELNINYSSNIIIYL